jgi:hypothetical protein
VVGEDELRAITVDDDKEDDDDDESPLEFDRPEMLVRRFGGGSSENPSSSACHACSLGDMEAPRL